jgi:hypothetical protein
MASILSLPSETQNRLQSFIKTVILWGKMYPSAGLTLFATSSFGGDGTFEATSGACPGTVW